MEVNSAGSPPFGPELENAVLSERLERRVVIYWYVTDLMRAAVAVAFLLSASHYFGEQYPKLPAITWQAMQAFAFGIVLLALITPPLAFSRWRFVVDEQLMRMRYGILFVEERLVPVPRMQHLDLVRGPIERMFGLATLVVFTAGNEGSSFRVPGLSVPRAEELRDRILRLRGANIL
ncbi:hypothetical protein LBMAG49_10160 [Planctomycetota bacterium]|nr:hypothetical protein LBMAG49_10160 [Planctomycetota bacterium]